MSNPYELLGLDSTATKAEAKAAYHAKLREFPAHSHPTEFKAIRSAYEAIQSGQAQLQIDAQKAPESFFAVQTLDISLDQAALAEVRQQLMATLEVSLADLLLDTF